MASPLDNPIKLSYSMTERVYNRRRPLPRGLRADGRPIWEPPILDYRTLVDEDQYEKRYETVLKYYNGNVARASDFMDKDAEVEMMKIQRGWVQLQCQKAFDSHDYEQFVFMEELEKSISMDFTTVKKEFEDLRIVLWPDGERKWKVQERFREKASAEQRRGEDPNATIISTVETAPVAQNTTTPGTMRGALPNSAPPSSLRQVSPSPNLHDQNTSNHSNPVELRRTNNPVRRRAANPAIHENPDTNTAAPAGGFRLSTLSGELPRFLLKATIPVIASVVTNIATQYLTTTLNSAVGNLMPVTLNSAAGGSEESQDLSYLSNPIEIFEVGSPRWQMHMEELDMDRQANRWSA